MKTNDFHHTSTLLSRISVWVRDALNYSETNQGEGGYQQLQSLLLEMNCSNSIHRLIQHSYRTPSHVQYFHSTLKSILSDQNPHLEEEEEGEGVGAVVEDVLMRFYVRAKRMVGNESDLTARGL